MGIYEVKNGSEVFLMDKELVYAVWYHKLFGKNKTAKKALGFYKSFEKLYDALINDKDETGFTDKIKPEKLSSFSLLDAELVIKECEENGWKIIPSYSKSYPKQLLSIGDYPEILFCDGKTEVLERSMTVGIVGSREAVADAEVTARNAAYNLAKTGAVIVSGAALGIDSCAHLGAVDAGGLTVGVLGCGLGSSYMKRIGDFYDKIRNNGCYITELFPYTNASKFTFPERNRLISGLSRALLVACAAENSGSLITAELAKKQKRRVYAMAPEICYSIGCEKLIADGAYSFYTAGDIAYPMKEFYEAEEFSEAWCNRPVTVKGNDVKREDMALPKKKTGSSSVKKDSSRKTAEKPAEKEEEPKKLPSLSENAEKIYELLGEEAVLMNSLTGLTGLKINQVLTGVGELTMKKLIKQLPGSRIQKV